MSTDNNPCPINHKHVIALSGAILAQLAYILTDVRILWPLMLLAGISAMLYESSAFIPWLESHLGKKRIPLGDYNRAHWISLALSLIIATLFNLTDGLNVSL